MTIQNILPNLKSTVNMRLCVILVPWTQETTKIQPVITNLFCYTFAMHFLYTFAILFCFKVCFLALLFIKLLRPGMSIVPLGLELSLCLSLSPLPLPLCVYGGYDVYVCLYCLHCNLFSLGSFL